MITIWKFKITEPVYQTFRAYIIKPLFVGLQKGEPYLWALVDTDKEPINYNIRIIGTGHEIGEIENEEKCNYIGSFISDEGESVWHIFELAKTE